MKHIGLVSCTRAKVDHETTAKDLYRGLSFISARAIVEEICDEWFILSAKHGLLHPNRLIGPYDVDLREFHRDDLDAWTSDVLTELVAWRVTHAPIKVTIIAADVYVEQLMRLLEQLDVEMHRRPRIDIIGQASDRWYIACSQCGACGPFRHRRTIAIQDAITHPCATPKE